MLIHCQSPSFIGDHQSTNHSLPFLTFLLPFHFFIFYFFLFWPLPLCLPSIRLVSSPVTKPKTLLISQTQVASFFWRSLTSIELEFYFDSLGGMGFSRAAQWSDLVIFLHVKWSEPSCQRSDNSLTQSIWGQRNCEAIFVEWAKQTHKGVNEEYSIWCSAGSIPTCSLTLTCIEKRQKLSSKWAHTPSHERINDIFITNCLAIFKAFLGISKLTWV